MLTRKRFMKQFILLMVLSLVIAACDRPLPNNDDDSTQTNENTGYPVATQAGAGEVGGNTATDPGEPGESEAEVPAEETPEAPAEAGEEGGSEGEPSEAEVPEEPTPGGSEGVEGEVPESSEEEGAGESEGEAEAEGEAEEAAEGAEEAVEEGEASEVEVPAEAGEGAEGEAAEGEAEVSAEAESGETESVPGTTLPATHTVAAGENLYRIGLQYGLSWVVIAQANGITNPDRIYEGQVLNIPGGGSGEPGSGGQPEPMPTPEGINYVVKPGDTLFKIAQQFKISWTEIAEANGLVNPNEIYAGQMLKIPVDGPQTVQHVVQPGETLFRISLHYGVSWLAIAHANKISAPYYIYAGQTLIIPGGH